MDTNAPIPPDLQPQPPEPLELEDDRPRKGGLVRVTFYGDTPTLERLERIVEKALADEGFDANASRSEWT